MSLRGSLSDFALDDVLRLLEATGKTGVLELRGPRGRGSLELTGGRLTAARYGDDSGHIALGAVLATGIGDFAFRAGDAGAPNLDGPLDGLLARGRQEAERIAATRALIRRDESRFALSGRASARASFSVTGDQWRVLLTVDGRRDVAGVALALGYGRLATLRILGELMDSGLVDAIEPTAETDVERRPVAREEEEAPAAHASRRATPRRARLAAPPSAPVPPSPLVAEPVPEAEPTSWAQWPPEPDAARAEAPRPDVPWAIPAAALDSAERTATPPPDEGATDVRLAALFAPDDGARLTEVSGPGTGAAMTASGEVGPDPAAHQPEPVSPSTEDVAEVTGEDAREEVTERGEESASTTPRQPSGSPGIRGVLTALAKAVRRTPEPVAAPGPATAPPSAPEPVRMVTPADLARLANALVAEYASGRYGVWPDQDIHARLRRVYQSNPLGRPLPVSNKELDVRALEDPHLEPGLALPFIALLIRDLREDAERCFGGEGAERGFRAAVIGLRGWDEAFANAPADIIARYAAPTHGRITLTSGSERKAWDLARRDYVIGSSPLGTDIRLEVETVAEHHVKLSPYLDGFLVRDIGSAGGTMVDGTQLDPLVGERFIGGGETIVVGGIDLLYERVPDRGTAAER